MRSGGRAGAAPAQRRVARSPVPVARGAQTASSAGSALPGLDVRSSGRRGVSRAARQKRKRRPGALDADRHPRARSPSRTESARHAHVGRLLRHGPARALSGSRPRARGGSAGSALRRLDGAGHCARRCGATTDPRSPLRLHHARPPRVRRAPALRARPAHQRISTPSSELDDRGPPRATSQSDFGGVVSPRVASAGRSPTPVQRSTLRNADPTRLRLPAAPPFDGESVYQCGPNRLGRTGGSASSRADPVGNSCSRPPARPAGRGYDRDRATDVGTLVSVTSPP